MKLRIKGNSLRLRISPSDMSRLIAQGRIEEAIHFGLDPRARLSYALELVPNASAITIRYEPREIIVLLPSYEARQWAAGQEVGLYGQSATSRGPLQLAIEKDFACLDASDAENADTFPHPGHRTVC